MITLHSTAKDTKEQFIRTYIYSVIGCGNKYLIFYQFYEMLRRPVNNIVLFLKVPNFLRNSGAVT
jgi:hypothetical protein